MEMNNTNKIEIIRECIDKKMQISIEREEIDDESLSTIPIAVSDQLLIVEYLYDFNFDGFKVLCMNDISKIKRGKVEEFHDKILISEGLIVKEELMSDIKTNTWFDFFESMLDKRKMIDISLERVNKGRTFFVGKIVSVKKEYLEILEVDIVGNWYKDVTQIFYENITLVSFANRYCEILNKYCSQAL